MPERIKRSFKTKNQYQKFVNEYQRRRAEFKKKHNIRGTQHNCSPRIIAQLYRMTHNIEKWNRRIKLIEKKEAIMYKVANCIEEYTGKKVQNSMPSKSNHWNRVNGISELRAIFVKICMDNGVNGIYCAWFVGTQSSDWAGHTRLRFIRSWNKYPARKLLYYNIKQYINDHCAIKRIDRRA